MAKMWKSRLKNLLKSRWIMGGKNCGKCNNFFKAVDKIIYTHSFSSRIHIVLNRFFTSVRIVSFPLFTHSLILQLLNN